MSDTTPTDSAANNPMPADPVADPPVTVLPDTIGREPVTIQVELSTRFLEHFSEQLYSSPQKAFEELISNSWDAGATSVDIRVSPSLDAPTATMCVFDNGESMDEDGLRTLWKIAFSPKPQDPVRYGRQVIGRFGIGKLATYVLARKLTYICKASDGIIRRVTMDYGEIDHSYGADPNRLVSELALQVFQVTEAEVAAALANVDNGPDILDLINSGGSHPRPPADDDDFGAAATDSVSSPTGTWTLVVLSDLKPTGRQLRLGTLRRMLEAALPIGHEMAIHINGSALQSSKVDAQVLKEWVIGPGLGIDSIALAEDPSDDGSIDTNSSSSAEQVALTYAATPVPHVIIPDIGVVTGRIRLYADRISGTKSDERGASNGFHVNVLGRVVNQADPSFGERNLNHAAWARFRMTVRADGLSHLLTTDREKLRDGRELRLFRAFMRRAFNTARSYWDADSNVTLPDGGDELVRSLGVLSLTPLRNVVSDALTTTAPIVDLFDETDIADRLAMRDTWRTNTSDSIRNALGEVRYAPLSADDGLVRFRIADSSVVVNKNHPFVVEHSHTKAEKELMRTVAMVTLLVDMYALDVGVDPNVVAGLREYRDRLMRFKALQRRSSGTYIAQLLLTTARDSDHSRRLELVVGDALRYLGFHVREIGGSGEPEGVASAYPLPTNRTATTKEPEPPLYKFTFDAKSSRHGSASTGNLGLDGIVEHRERYGADFALVVAPGFSAGALDVRADQQKVTPITAADLGRLLEYTVEYGAIPLPVMQSLFTMHTPDAVHSWIDDLGSSLLSRRSLTIDIFLGALAGLKGKVPDALPAALIAFQCREAHGVPSVTEADVLALARGLEVLIPDLIGVQDDKVVVNASAERVAAAVSVQLAKLKDSSAVVDS